MVVSRSAAIPTQEIDPKGPGIVEEIFRYFEARGDRVGRIVCGGAKHLKTLQRHDCFEPCLPDDVPRDEEGTIPKGVLFGARVYRSKQLEPNAIVVEGQTLEPGRAVPIHVVQFIEKR